jgi:NADH:ubiquinone oxidoreductase subunit
MDLEARSHVAVRPHSAVSHASSNLARARLQNLPPVLIVMRLGRSNERKVVPQGRNWDRQKIVHRVVVFGATSEAAAVVPGEDCQWMHSAMDPSQIQA